MKLYVSDEKTKKLRPVEKKDRQKPLLKIITGEELKEQRESFLHYKELLHSLGSVRYCKADCFDDCLFGTLLVPQKKESRQVQVSFLFYMTNESLVFIEDSGDLKRWVDSHLKKLGSVSTSSELLLEFLSLTVENDVLYLSHLESDLEKTEDELLKEVPDDFFADLTSRRRKLSQLHSYYSQLEAVGELLASKECSYITNGKQWGAFAGRVARLHEHVHLLRENVVQLRELYRSMQQDRQNRVMGILTVVTTLFLPLTLLTGWYGMNFSSMPELHMKYGYVGVIAAAVIIVVLEIVFFIRKKFF